MWEQGVSWTTMAAWLARLAELPVALLWIGGVAALVVSASTASREELPRRWRRCGAAAFGLLLAGLALHAGRFVLVASSVPKGVWLVGALLGWLAFAFSGTAALVVFVLWLLSLGAVMAWLVGIVGDPRVLEGLLLLLGLAAFVPSLWVNARTPVPKRTPPPPLAEQLDSDEAQEGADKYTRE